MSARPVTQHRLLTAALCSGFPTAKHLAAAGGVSVQTAERYRRGETSPDALTVAKLMRHSDVVVQAMLRLAGLDDLSLEQEQVRLVRALADIEQKRAARNAVLAEALAVAGRQVSVASGAPDQARRCAAPTADRPADGAAAPRVR